MMTNLKPSAHAKPSFDTSGSELAAGGRSSSEAMAVGGAESELAAGDGGEVAAPERYEAPFSLGDSFMKFELRAELGRGGQALVLEGYDAFLDRTVAIKFIAPREEKMRRMLAKRARAEARVLSRLEHENVVRVFDAGPMPDGSVYIVMERLYGQTLRAALRQRGSLGIPEVLTIGIQISRGVAAAHDMGVIHRDLKPENVFIEAGNRVKVVDFGIAKVLGDDINTTQRDRVHGTVLYMSPEHLKGLGVTPQSDVYALGTMLYEALHRHPALVDGKPREWLQVALFQVQRLPTPLDQVDPAFPHYLSRILQRATAKEPEVRFPTMRELSGALEQALERYRGECQAAGVGVVIEDLSLVRQCDDAESPALGHASSSVQVGAAQIAALHNHATVPLSDYFPGDAPKRLPSRGRSSRVAAVSPALSESLDQEAIATRTARGPGVVDAAGSADPALEFSEPAEATADSSEMARRSPHWAVATATVLLSALGVWGAFMFGRSTAGAGLVPASSAEPGGSMAARAGSSAVPAISAVLAVPSASAVVRGGVSTMSAELAAPSASSSVRGGVVASALPREPPGNDAPKAQGLAEPSKPVKAKPPRGTKRVRPTGGENTLAEIDDNLAYFKRDNERRAQQAASAAAKRGSPTGASSTGGGFGLPQGAP